MSGPEGKYAWAVTMGEKGQIVIPKAARELFAMKPGDSIILLADVERGIAIPPRAVFSQFAEQIFLDKGADNT